MLACPLGRLLISPPSSVGSSSSSASSSASSVLVPGLAGGLEHGDFDPSAAACHLERGGAVLVINHGGVGVGKVNETVRRNLDHITASSVYDVGECGAGEMLRVESKR